MHSPSKKGRKNVHSLARTHAGGELIYSESGSLHAYHCLLVRGCLVQRVSFRG
jgi:hypothetical protein